MKPGFGPGDRDLLGGDSLVFDAAVDEASELGGSTLDLSSVGGDGELLEELVKHLDGLSVLGRHDGGCCRVSKNIDRVRGMWLVEMNLKSHGIGLSASRQRP